MENIITLTNVTKKFKEATIINNVTLNIKSNTIVGIIGRNGSGKTVLLKLIAGLYLVDSGKIVINNYELTKTSSIPLDTGVLIDTGFLKEETGFENLRLLSSLKAKLSKGQICDVLTFVGLDPWSNTKYRNYSTGMKQKLKFAQAIMENPNILILDEPFNGMDKESVENLREQLLKLKKEGKTIIITSHYQEDLNYLCDEIFEMNNGIIEKARIKNDKQKKK